MAALARAGAAAGLVDPTRWRLAAPVAIHTYRYGGALHLVCLPFVAVALLLSSGVRLQ